MIIEVDGSTAVGKREIIESLMKDVTRAAHCWTGGSEIYLSRKQREIEQWVERLKAEHPEEFKEYRKG